MEEKSDQELISEALLDRHAFAAIVLRYQSALQRYIRRLGCQDPHDQEDVLQEIFLKIYVNLNDYDSNLKFSSWLYRIAHNETISFFRKKKIRPAPVVTEEELEQFQNLADGSDIPETYDKELEARILREALGQIDEQYRDALTLRFLEDKNYTEISDILKIPVATVGTHINRGKKQLKQLLEKRKHI